MKIYQTSMDYNYLDWPGEINTSPSQTIPDQTMSLKEIIERHTRGLPALGKEPIYHGEDIEIPNFAKMDLAEQQEMRDTLKLYIAEQEEKLRESHTARKAQLAKDTETKKKAQWADFMNFQKQQNEKPKSEQPGADG